MRVRGGEGNGSGVTPKAEHVCTVEQALIAWSDIGASEFVYVNNVLKCVIV